MAITNVNQQSFQETLDNNELVLVDFWAPWCGPCKMLAPTLDKLDEELGDTVTIAKVNVDENGPIAEKFGIMGIPTLKLFKNGEEVQSVSGVQPLDKLKDLISQHK
ncbi:thioredoxin [Paenibacillus larvae]|uniref:Thioredoxin n=1 Tax=Paenibacillus larvae subsp. larvae TaxID=147375 RepID=A0A6C0QPF5_9BACL|nr:thioredoxin [Paenibacillus larvae]MCY9510197.1 thioredoxin [Paenibacillus larvae]MCY9524170.1 thioredoxin [Paenibacillus larvae]QHZ50450.1 thioredoxin TrxA [Paenibacillus larvae subsp. larvae]